MADLTESVSGESTDNFGLVWGIKRSFIAYLARQPDASNMYGDGAEGLVDGRYFFTLGNDEEFDRRRLTGTLKFRGTIRLMAHRNRLVVTISDPWIVFDGQGKGTLSTSTRNNAEDEDTRHDLVHLTVSPTESDAQAILWAGIRTSLAPGATQVFNEVYPPHEDFDPLVIRIPRVSE